MNLPTQTPSVPVAVVTPLQSNTAGLYLNSNNLYTRFSITGEDAYELLSRISATRLGDLKSPESAVFVDEKGRYVALCTLWQESSDLIKGVIYAKDSKNFSDHIQKYTILEEVEYKSLADDFSQITVLGVDQIKDLNSVSNMFLSPYKSGIKRFEIVFSSSHEQNVKSCLKEANLQEISLDDYELMRIKNFWVADGLELTKEHNPIEAGLTHLIDFERCYIGQEVLSRLWTYDKIKQNLSLFKLRDADSFNDSEDSSIYFGNSRAGKITSTNLNYALGYLKKGVGVKSKQSLSFGTNELELLSKFPSS